MTANGYTRTSAANISTGLTINASDLNAEYNALQSAFDGSSGHNHSGGTGLGQPIVLTTAVSGILPVANGGTNNAYFGVAGPTSARTYTFPDSDSTVVTSTVSALSSLATVGTITSGTWNGTTIAVAHGGTGVTSLSSIASLSGLTTVGTIGTGVWQGTVVGAAYGGTGVSNTGTITLGGSITTGGAFTTSGASALTLTTTGSTNVTLPTSGTICTTAGSSSIVTVGTISSGTWNGNIIGAAFGGTGVSNNALNTVTFSGNFGLTVTLTNTTSVTFPTSGTLATTAVSTLSSLTTAGSLVTVGTISTGTWAATKVGLAYGGTNADLSATGGTSQVLKQVSAGAAVTVGQLAFTDISGNLAASQLNGMSVVTNSLSGDVTLTTIATYYDGPSIAQGTSGKWFVSGTVTLIDTSGAAQFVLKLWDGTTVIASSVVLSIAANDAVSASLSGYISSPAANLKISVQNATRGTTGKIVFNQSGASMDATLTAIRIG